MRYLNPCSDVVAERSKAPRCTSCQNRVAQRWSLTVSEYLTVYYGSVPNLQKAVVFIGGSSNLLDINIFLLPFLANKDAAPSACSRLASQNSLLSAQSNTICNYWIGSHTWPRSSLAGVQIP